MSARTRATLLVLVLAGLVACLAFLSERETRGVATSVAATSPAQSSGDLAPELDASRPTSTHDASSAAATASELDALAGIVAAHVCATRDACGCGPWPEGRSCEVEAVHDFQAVWARRAPRVPITLPSREALDRALDEQLSCSSTLLDLGRLALADADEGAPCSFVSCRGGLSCWRGRCTRTASEGESCDDGLSERPCEEPMSCVRGRCVRPLLEGESCEEPEIRCSSELSCREGRCVRPRLPGDECGLTAPCIEEARCVAGRCRLQACDSTHPCPLSLACAEGSCVRDCPDDMIERATSSGPRHSIAKECIPVGAACSRASDCGSGACVGAGPRVCMAAGPHASVNERSSARTSRRPTCEVDEVCDTMAYATTLLCDCPDGTICEYAVGEIVARCRRLGVDGDPCSADHCGPGLACDRRALDGSHCVSRICSAPPFFVDTERPYSPWAPQ